jgi:hypothetical protein
MLKYFLNSWYKFSEKKPKKVNIPLNIPTEVDLRHWACSEWIEYQAWLFHMVF